MQDRQSSTQGLSLIQRQNEQALQVLNPQEASSECNPQSASQDGKHATLNPETREDNELDKNASARQFEPISISFQLEMYVGQIEKEH